ncbi:septum formation initiator family protein [uncultured Granulicatella sp.]|uniref:FtsB family cell division protein n=1 Tax=uncultured Granulicatella sp. TaxID=316089 RepID=UPI0028D0BBC5|nr:septum formation initiator family protein [uncultured Granulicatella sp.]
MNKQQEENSKIIAFESKKKKLHTNVHLPKVAVWKRVAVWHSLLMAVVIAIAGSLILQIVGQINQAGKIEAQIVEAKKEEAKVKQEQKSLVQQVELLQQDDYVAKLARSEYYLSKSGEIIFNTPDDAAQNKIQQAKENQSRH